MADPFGEKPPERKNSQEYPVVNVQEITEDVTQSLQAKHEPRDVNLGGQHSEEARQAEYNVNLLTYRMRKSGGRRFLLSWEGNKIPRGAKVLGDEIGWTQNGQVLTTEGKMIGTYDRLVEFGGTSGKEQKMTVYLLPEKKSE